MLSDDRYPSSFNVDEEDQAALADCLIGTFKAMREVIARAFQVQDVKSKKYYDGVQAWLITRF